MIKLRPYQEKFVTEIAQKLASGKRSVVGQLATGAGKTIIFSSICKRFCDKWEKRSVLVLVHRKELLQQTRRTLWDGYNISAQPIVAGMRNINPAQVYVAMIESAYRRIDNIPTDIGLVIIDEAHISSFTKIHKHFPNTMTIGFTATPISAKKSEPMNRYYEDIVCGVDIPDLIVMKSLCQNITIAPKDSVDRASLTIKRGDFDEGLMALQFSKPKYIQNTLAAYQKYTPGSKAIVFNITVEHSLLVCNAFVEAGLPCKHVDGLTPAKEREEIFKWFKSTENAILCNVGIATVGFDDPSIETVIVNRATTSLPLWLQMCGRGGRIHDGKAMFTIIDMGGNAVVHGDWCQPRDWENIFHNPPKAGEGGGVAPVKVCPSCECIIPAQCRRCPECGYLYPEKEVEQEEKLGEFVLVTRNINPLALIEEHREKKEYYVFFKIGKELATQARNTIRNLTNEDAEFIFSKCEELSKQWCHARGKRYNQWHRDMARKNLYNELSLLFKKWENPLAKDEIVNPINLPPVSSLTPLKSL